MTTGSGTGRPRQDRWRGREADRAADLVSLLAERLADPRAVAETAARLEEGVPPGSTGAWVPAGLAAGHPGIALFYGHLAETEDRHAAVAHRHLLAAMRAVRTTPPRGLFLGPASVAFAAQTCGAHTGAYTALRATLLNWTAEHQVARIDAALAGRTGTAEGTYDVVTGISGLGRVLLDAMDDPAEHTAAVAAATAATMRYLVRLSRPRSVRGRQVPGWWTSPEQLPLDHDRRRHPDGAVNVGMAHGIAGPLALLALAARRDVTVDGHLDAIRFLCGWLADTAVSDEDGPFWPSRVGLSAGADEQPVRSRDGWCYGVYGVATALYHAGTALNCAEWRALAIRAVRGALARGTRPTDPYLCHGYAGVLHTVHRLAVAENDATLLRHAFRLATEALAFVDGDAPFVVTAPAHDVATHGYRVCHRAGLLDGAAGLGCAMWTLLVGLDSARTRAWDRMLLLS
ncbi:lanthionine synthetase C family protein [Actinophytocola sp.]|uniref:lanthionine synthetase C family protein n=1 Tax=Actinophytocola sp. TaxID=1872138 RepID=UPI00389A8AEA